MGQVELSKKNLKHGGMEESEEVEYSELTDKIIGVAMKVHSAIGPGVLESVYKTCMAHELKKLGLGVSCEVFSRWYMTG
jgi:PD-(D/E)XK nuclease superfamily